MLSFVFQELASITEVSKVHHLSNRIYRYQPLDLALVDF